MWDLRKVMAYVGFLIYIVDIIVDWIIACIYFNRDEYLYFGLSASFISISSIMSNVFAHRALWDEDEGYDEEFLKFGKKGIRWMAIFQVLPTYSHIRNLYLIWKGVEEEVVWVNKNLKLLYGMLHAYPQICLQSIVITLAMTEDKIRYPYIIQWLSLFLSVWVFAHGFITYAFNSMPSLDKIVLFFGCSVTAVSRMIICCIMSSYDYCWALWFLPSGISLAVVISIYIVCSYFKTARLTQQFFTKITEHDIDKCGVIKWMLCSVFDTFSWTGLCVSGVYLITSVVAMFNEDRRSKVALALACFTALINTVSVFTRKYRLLWAGNTDLY